MWDTGGNVRMQVKMPTGGYYVGHRGKCPNSDKNADMRLLGVTGKKFEHGQKYLTGRLSCTALVQRESKVKE